MILALCAEALQTVQEVVASLSSTVLEDIRAPISDAGDLSPKKEGGKDEGDADVFGDSDELGDVHKIKSCAEARNIVFFNDNDKADDGWSDF